MEEDFLEYFDNYRQKCSLNIYLDETWVFKNISQNFVWNDRVSDSVHVGPHTLIGPRHLAPAVPRYDTPGSRISLMTCRCRRLYATCNCG